MTNDVLEAPVDSENEAPALAEKGDVATPSVATTTAITVVARAELALGSEKARKELKELASKSANVKELKDKAGRDECHSFAMALVKARTTVSKISKDAREDANKFQKAVIAEEAILISLIQPEEKRLLDMRDAWDKEEKERKEAEAAANRKRIVAINEKIANIRGYAGMAVDCRTSERVQILIDKLKTTDHGDFQEFKGEAEMALRITLEAMQRTFDTKKDAEDERERVRKQQAEEAERIAAQRAELEKAQKAAEEAEAARKAEREREEAAAQARRDAEAADLARQRAELEEQQRKLAEAKAELEAQKAPPALVEQAPIATETVAPEVELAQAKASQEGAELSDAAQEIYEQEGAARFATAHPTLAQAHPAVSDDPSDADVIWTAANAVAQGYQMTVEQAMVRLAAISTWTV